MATVERLSIVVPLHELGLDPFKPQRCCFFRHFSLFLLTLSVVSDKIGIAVANILADLTQ